MVYGIGARALGEGHLGQMHGPGPPMPIEHTESSGREFLFYGEQSGAQMGGFLF